MLRTVVLHGALAARFGRAFELDVRSPAEAVRALIVQLKGFRQALRDGAYRIVRAREAVADSLDLPELKLRLGKARELHIVPVVAGAASGWGKILTGVAIIALAIAAPYALGMAGATIGATLGTSAIGIAGIGTFGQIAMFGAMVALGGISQMLTKAPTAASTTSQDQNASFLFGSADNVTVQGGPVPVVVGEFVVGSVVVSSGLSTEEIGTGGGPQIVVSDGRFGILAAYVAAGGRVG
jgi:predicted phage tail protein